MNFSFNRNILFVFNYIYLGKFILVQDTFFISFFFISLAHNFVILVVEWFERVNSWITANFNWTVEQITKLWTKRKLVERWEEIFSKFHQILAPPINWHFFFYHFSIIISILFLVRSSLARILFLKNISTGTYDKRLKISLLDIQFLDEHRNLKQHFMADSIHKSKKWIRLLWKQLVGGLHPAIFLVCNVSNIIIIYYYYVIADKVRGRFYPLLSCRFIKADVPPLNILFNGD